MLIKKKNLIALASNLCPRQGWRMWLQRSFTGMSCVNVNSYAFDRLPHTARGIPLSEGTVGSILTFVGQLSLVAWMRIKNGRDDGTALSIRTVPPKSSTYFSGLYRACQDCMSCNWTFAADTDTTTPAQKNIPQDPHILHEMRFMRTDCKRWVNRILK